MPLEFHIAMSVSGALRWSDAEAKRNCNWIKIDGKHPTVEELRRYLTNLLAKGVKVLPYGCRGHEVSKAK